MSTQMNTDDLDRKLFKCADKLRGNVAKERYKNYISPLLFLYAYESEKQNLLPGAPSDPNERQEYIAGHLRYRPPQETTLDDFQYEHTNLAEHIDNWFAEFARINKQELNNEELLDKEFSAEVSLTDTVIKGLLDELNTINFDETPADLIGESYMNLMKQFAHEEKGEYFTPPKYSKLIAKSLYTLDNGFNVKASFHDPTVGSAGLLIAAAELYKDDPDNLINKNYTEVEETQDTVRFSGQERDPQIVKLSVMNTSLHNLPYADIRRGDSLSNPQFTNNNTLETFDYIIANPPFSMEWDKNRFQENDEFNRFNWHEKLPRADRADYAFLMHMLAHTAEDGMIASVVPQGMLSRIREQRYRDYLLENDYVEAVISLPEEIFESTDMPTAILILNKDKPTEHQDEVLFVNADVKDRFYNDDSSRNELLDEGIDDICDILGEWRTEERVSRAVSVEEIADFDNNLTLSLYVDTTEPQTEIDLDGVQARHDELLDECVQLNDQIKTQITNLEL